jgi:hypothetical protein
VEIGLFKIFIRHKECSSCLSERRSLPRASLTPIRLLYREALLQSHRPFTPCSQPSDLMTKLSSEPRPTDLYSLCLGSRHASSGPFANLLRLYLR